MNITDAELWELFTGEQTPPYRFLVRDPHKTNCMILDPGKQTEFIQIKGIVANIPKSNINSLRYYNGNRVGNPNDIIAYAGYFLRLLWIRENWMLDDEEPCTADKNELVTFFRGALILNGIEVINDDTLQCITDNLLTSGYIQKKDEDRWKPGMKSGSGWTSVFSLSLVGKKVAQKMIEDIFQAAKNEEQKELKDQFFRRDIDVRKIDPKLFESVSEETPILVSAASGKGNRPTSFAELKAEEAAMSWQDEPADVRLSDDHYKKTEEAVYRGTLRAGFVQKKLTEKEQNILLNETLGIGPTEIARRNGTPEKDVESDSDKIRKQIDRFKKKR